MKQDNAYLKVSISKRHLGQDWSAVGGLSDSTRFGLQVAILVGTFLLLYIPTFRTFATMWVDHQRLEGFLIPLISLYMIWLKRDEWRRIEVIPATSWGASIVILAGMLLLLGELSGIAVLSEISLVVMIGGLVLLLLGKAFLKALSFPIAYLCFMLSIVEDLIAPMHWPLQLLTARVSGEFLQMLGLPILVQRQFLVLPSMTLEVARDCSGATFLVSIIAIGIPLSYLTLRTWRSRTVLILSSVAIGLIANWIRVVLIAIGAYLGGQPLHGPFHIFQGLFVAWVGYAALFAGAWGFSKIDKPISGASLAGMPVVLPSDKRAPWSYAEWNRSWLMAFLILVTFASYIGWYDPGRVDLKKDLVTVPISLGGWSGEQNELREAIFRVHGADHELVRTYRSREGYELQLYIAYLNSQRHGKEIVGNATMDLHRNAELVEIPVSSGQVVSVNRSSLVDTGDTHRIIFWYDINDRIVASPYQAKVATTLDALIYGRTNGALVLIAAMPGPRKATHAVIENFTRDLFPILRIYFL